MVLVKVSETKKYWGKIFMSTQLEIQLIIPRRFYLNTI